jgi:hypothetical protein
MLTFRTSSDEAEANTAVAGQTASTNEAELAPGGIIGFSLDYRQVACT